MPEPLAAHMKERIGHVALAAGRTHQIPVPGKTFNEVKAGFNKWGSQFALGGQVHYRQKQKGLVRGAEGSGLGPAIAVFISTQPGQLLQVVIHHAGVRPCV